MNKSEAKDRVDRILKGNTKVLSSHQIAGSTYGMEEEDIEIAKEQLHDLIDRIYNSKHL
jgi:hypothetical protein